MRVASVLIIFAALALGAALPAAPAPFSRVKWDAVDGDDLRLTIRHRTEPIEERDSRFKEERAYDVDIRLLNLADKRREVKLRANAYGISGVSGISYVARFPDGKVLEWYSVDYVRMEYVGDPSGPLIELPAGGSVSGVAVLDVPHGGRYLDLYHKFNGQFCVTAVVGWLGLQSNTLKFNGCPDPPRGYRPLDHTRYLPGDGRKAKPLAQLYREGRISREEYRDRGERVIQEWMCLQGYASRRE